MTDFRIPTVLVDCDGPMANFTQGYLDAVHFLTGHIIEDAMVDRWHIHECPWFVDLAGGHLHPKLKRDVEAIIEKEGFCQELQMTPHAREAIDVIREWADVYVVTSPWQSSKTWTYDRNKWLKRNFDIDPSHVIYTQKKHMVVGDIFVDDKPEHVAAWIDGMIAVDLYGREGYVFAQSHNRHVTRRDSWADVIDGIDAWIWDKSVSRWTLGTLQKAFKKETRQ
jgi:5'(3')-deoxyribonucleotidase